MDNTKKEFESGSVVKDVRQGEKGRRIMGKREEGDEEEIGCEGLGSSAFCGE